MTDIGELLDGLDLDALTDAEADALLEELVGRAAVKAQWLDRTVREYPLVGWVAWDCPPPATSQRRAMLSLGEVCTFLFGGNRSGKTEALRALAVAFALGRSHPMVRWWADANGFDLEAMGIPLGPGRVFLVAKSSNDSIRYHRKQIERLLPRGSYDGNNIRGRGEAVFRIRVPGYEDEAEIWFKSEDQGREGMQGDSIRFVGVDEEIAEDIWDELLLRVADQQGVVVCSMTPLKGLTWVYERYSGERKAPEEGSRAHWLDALDNPHLPREWFERLYRSMSPAAVEARRHGKFTVLEGLIYPTWNRSTHVASTPIQVGADWLRFRILDHGVRHNTSVLWGALAPSGQTEAPPGQLVIYRALYAPRLSTAELARRIREAEGYVLRPAEEVSPAELATRPEWEHAFAQRGPDGTVHLPQRWDPTGAERMEGAVADPSATQVLRDLSVIHGIEHGRAKRDWRAGLSAVESRLAIEDDGTPGLVVNCDERGNPVAPDLVREIESYTDPRPGTQRETPPPRPISGDDAVDTLRYLCMRVRMYDTMIDPWDDTAG